MCCYAALLSLVGYTCSSMLLSHQFVVLAHLVHNGSGKMAEHEAGSQSLECTDLTLAVETFAIETQNSKFS